MRLTTCLILAASTALHAQSVTQSAADPASRFFTASDALDINTWQVADVTDDGRWVAMTHSIRRDGFGNDYRRDGDPSYLRVTPVRLWVIDSRSGQRTAVFPDKRPVRAARWSPDGSQLAFLMLTGEALEASVWNRATGKVTALKLPTGKYVAEQSDVRWTAGGTKLVVAVHTTEWKKKATAMFTNNARREDRGL